jgi:dTDP-4-amino-4,6-dideoxygalactose transaminase
LNSLKNLINWSLCRNYKKLLYFQFMINVTKAFLPALSEYTNYLERIWERGWLTNYGPLVLELEEQLKKYLGVKHLFTVNNGTIALQIVIKGLNLKGEIITTPFSYVATTASIVWENCEPVFVDIDPNTLCLDPQLIEQKITPNTSAILATHVYGNACDVEAIEKVAKKHNLKVIYDAAHAFAVNYKGQSLLNYGNVSTLSFHATKLFHTIEGGAIITNDDDLAHKLSYMCNFGHNGPEDFIGLGTNAKLSEFHAAMGLCVLPKVQELISIRKNVSHLYDKLFQNLPFIRPFINKKLKYNYAYYPIILPNETMVLDIRKELNLHNIFPRRYFYPSLSSLNYVKEQEVPITENISSRILCLPLAHDLNKTSVEKIAGIIIKKYEECELQ